MLSSVLVKKECAVCRFCCSFRRKSLWELPKLPLTFIQDHKTGRNGEEIEYKVFGSGETGWAVTDLTKKYETDDPEEEVLCPFLDPDRGCVLPDEDKPFECSAWPVRLMKMPDGNKKVCLAMSCHAIKKADESVLREKAKSEWKEIMTAYAEDHPYTVGEYREGYVSLE